MSVQDMAKKFVVNQLDSRHQCIADKLAKDWNPMAYKDPALYFGDMVVYVPGFVSAYLTTDYRAAMLQYLKAVCDDMGLTGDDDVLLKSVDLIVTICNDVYPATAIRRYKKEKHSAKLSKAKRKNKITLQFAYVDLSDPHFGGFQRSETVVVSALTDRSRMRCSTLPF